MRLTQKDLHKLELEYTPRDFGSYIIAVGDIRVIELIKEIRESRKLLRKKRRRLKK